MKQLEYIADDFGLNEPVNLAVLRAHREGALTGASLMVGQPGTEHAVQLARATPSLAVGWHLHLCDSCPTTCERWPWGDAPFRVGLFLSATAAQRKRVRIEVAEQWREFAATGLRCAFVNGHHHLHVHPAVQRVLARVLPPEFAGWMRGFRVRRFGGGSSAARLTHWVSLGLWPWLKGRAGAGRFAWSDSLWGLDRTFRMQADEVRRAGSGLGEGRHEFVFHPRGGSADRDLATLLALKSGAGG